MIGLPSKVVNPASPSKYFSAPKILALL